MVFLKSFSTKNELINTLVHFGAHIGDFTNYKHFDQSISYYLFCIRHNVFVIDISRTVYIFQRSLHFIYLLSCNFGKLLFYHSSIDSYFLKFLFFYLIKHKTENSFINSKLQGGFLSNYRECFLRFIKTLSNIPMKIRSKRIFRIKLKFVEFDSQARNCFYFRYLFLKLVYLTFEKSSLKRDWDDQYKILLVFWKAFMFVRSFKSVFHLPDCLICINPENDWFVINEYSKTKKIPSISIVDTSTVFANTTFSIPSNDDSIALSLFYISVFINVWLMGHFSIFKVQ